MKFFDASRYASPLRKALAKKENAPRNLRFETLENRALLSVTPLDELQAAVASAEIAPAQTVETPVVDLSVLAVSNATAESVVETEPNDTLETAQDLGLLTQTTTIEAVANARLNSDYYKVTFEVDGANEHSIVLDNAWINPTPDTAINLNIYLLDENGKALNPLKQSTGNGRQETISLSGVKAGTYYIHVKQANSGSTFDHDGEGNYTLTIVPPAIPQDQYESNDTLQTAYDLGVLGETEISAKTGLNEEFDFFKFSTPATGSAADFVEINYTQAANTNIALALFDSADAAEPIRNITSTATTKTISLEGLPAGDYYVRVYNSDPQANQAVDYALKINAPSVAPTAPTTFQTNGDEATNNYTTLSWNNVFGETGYELEVSVNDGAWTPVATFAADATTSGKLDLAFATKYQYRLRAVNDFGQSDWVELADAFTTVEAPEPPEGLKASILDPETLTVDLSWTDLKNELGYEVKLLDADGAVVAQSDRLAADTTTWTTPALALGTTYQFQVTAINNAGDATSELFSFTTENVPTAPTGEKWELVPAPQPTATLAWNAVEKASDAEAVTNYVVTIYEQVDGADGEAIFKQTVAADQTALTLEAGLLEKGASYRFDVVAVNAYGESAPSTGENAYVTVGDVPAQPTVLAATVNPSTAPTATLKWDAVVSDAIAETVAGYEVTLYQIVVDADGETTVVALAPQTVTDATYTTGTLDLGGTYYFEVAAVNAYGKSEVAKSENFTVGTVPTAPSNVTLTQVKLSDADGTLVRMKWGDLEGETGYRVEYRETGTEEWTAFELKANAQSQSVYDFTPGQTYEFRVCAENVYGASAWSTASITPLVAPTVEIAAVDGNAKTATLALSAPANATQMRVEVSTEPFATEAAIPRVNLFYSSIYKAYATTATIKNLEPGATYYYRVYAINANGTSDWCDTATFALLDAPVVDAKLNASEIPTATLTWTNVANETGYVVEQLVDGAWVAASEQLPADTTSWTTASLELGATYAYRVVAVDACGQTASEAVEVLVGDVPLGATNLTAKFDAATQTATLTWIDAATNETGYVVEQLGADGAWAQIAELEADTISWTTETLVPGELYAYRVVAVNDYAKIASETVEIGVLTAPELTAETISASEITLTIADVANTVGYVVEYSTSADFPVDATVSLDATGTTTISDLDAYTTYYFRAIAKGEGVYAASDYSETVSATTALAAPSNVTLTQVKLSDADGTLVRMKWGDVEGETGYRVEYREAGAEEWTAFELKANAQSQSVYDFTPGQTYEFRVCAENVYGASAWSTASITPLVAPTVEIAAVDGNAKTATLALSAPANATQMRVEVSTEPFATEAAIPRVNLFYSGTYKAYATKATIKNLEPGATYYYRVYAINANGTSDWCDTATFALLDAPVADAELNASETPTATLTWTNVANETGYVVEQLVDGAWVAASEQLPADTTSWTTASLELGATYAYRVVAVDAYGQAAASEAVEVVVGNVPAQPTELKATVAASANPTATLTWAAEGATEGYVVTLYKVEADGTAVAFEPQTVADAAYTTGTLDLGGVYYFEVAAKNVYGESEVATSKTFTVGNVPAQPTDLEYEFNHYAKNAILTWTAVEGADAYVVEQLGADGEWAPVAPPVGNPETTETTWESGAFDFGTSHAFRVVAKNAYGSSVASDAVSFTIQDESTVVTSLEDGDLNLLDDVTTLREALRFAQDGDEIVFAEDLRGGTITLTGGPLSIMEKEISVNGFVDETGAPELMIDGDHKDMIFVVANTRASFFGLSVVNGYASYAKYGGGALGGGFSVDNANATFTNVDVIGCHADVYGGGIYIACNVEAPGQGKSTLTNVRILDNVSDNGESSGQGGGLYATGGFMGGEIEMTNVEISGNQARADGGGVFLNDITSTLTNVKITDNIAQGNGGAFYANAPDHTFISNLTGYPLLLISTKLTNVEITGNQAYKGFGFYAEEFDVEELSLRNVTLADNAGTQEGASGDVYLANGVATFYNSIVDGDVQGEEYAANAYNTLSSYTDWAKATDDGVVNYEIDATKPLFADAENGDYTLAENSQAINKGADAYVPETITTDLAGNNRFNGTVDAGAYESHAPFAPTDLVANFNFATRAATLSWIDNAQNETGYEVQLLGDDGEWTTVAPLAANANEWTQNALAFDSNYVYRVVAVNAYGRAASETVEVVVGHLPAAPSNVTLTQVKLSDADGTLVRMKWGDVEGETGYRVEYREAGTEEWTAFEPKANTQRYDFYNFTPGQTYEFRVRAENAYGASEWSTATLTPMAAPTVELTSVDGNAKTATLALSAPANATQMRVEVSTEPFATEAAIPRVNLFYSGTYKAYATKATIKNLEPGATYYYRVYAINANGTSDWCDTATFALLDAPTDVALSQVKLAGADGTFLRMKWTDVSDETGYRVEYREAGTEEWTAFELKANAQRYDFYDFTPGQTYEFRVRAENAYGASAWSTSSFTPLVAPTAEVVAISETAKTATLALSAPANATQMRVEVSTEPFATEAAIPRVNLFYSGTYKADATSATIKNLAPDATYYARVYAISADGVSDWCDVLTFSMQSAPSDVVFTADESDATRGVVSWTNNAADATEFRVETSQDGIVWELAATTTETSVELADLTPGEELYLRVRSQNAVGASAWSQGAILNAPTNLTFSQAKLADADGTLTRVKWNDASDLANLYRVEYREAGADAWTFVAYRGSGSQHQAFYDFTPGRTYEFRVRAENAYGASAWSTASFTPLVAPTVDVAAVDSTSFTLALSAPTGATKLRVEVSTEPFATEAAIPRANLFYSGTYKAYATSATIKNLAPDATYYVRVYSINAAGASDWCDTLEITLPSETLKTSNAVSEAFAELFADDVEDDFWFELESTLGKRK